MRPTSFYEHHIDRMLLIGSGLSLFFRSSAIVFLFKSYLIIDRLQREFEEKLLIQTVKEEKFVSVDSLSTSDNDFVSVNESLIDRNSIKPFSQEYYKQILGKSI
jgi:hypothetical protein